MAARSERTSPWSGETTHAHGDTTREDEQPLDYRKATLDAADAAHSLVHMPAARTALMNVGDRIQAPTEHLQVGNPLHILASTCAAARRLERDRLQNATSVQHGHHQQRQHERAQSWGHSLHPQHYQPRHGQHRQRQGVLTEQQRREWHQIHQHANALEQHHSAQHSQQKSRTPLSVITREALRQHADHTPSHVELASIFHDQFQSPLAMPANIGAHQQHSFRPVSPQPRIEGAGHLHAPVAMYPRQRPSRQEHAQPGTGVASLGATAPTYGVVRQRGTDTSGPSREFQCPHCSKKLRTKNGVKLHIESVHENLRHTCPTCSHRFTKAVNLRAHLASSGSCGLWSCRRNPEDANEAHANLQGTNCRLLRAQISGFKIYNGDGECVNTSQNVRNRCFKVPLEGRIVFEKLHNCTHVSIEYINTRMSRGTPSMHCSGRYDGDNFVVDLRELCRLGNVEINERDRLDISFCGRNGCVVTLRAEVCSASERMRPLVFY